MSMFLNIKYIISHKNSTLCPAEANQLLNKDKSFIEKPDFICLLRVSFQSHPFISEFILKTLFSTDKRREDGGMLE